LHPAQSLESSDKAKIARALRVIASQRSGDFTLQRAAAAMESGSSGSTLDVGDAYNRLQIGSRGVPDEIVFTYYQSLSNGAPSGSKDSYTEALRVIALDRQSNFLLRKLEDPNADVQASTSEPVGLDNIGNTCYLNSLLQYYYTINPVRGMVINFQQHRMGLNDEDIKNKRVGGRIVDKSEIIKAQKCKSQPPSRSLEIRLIVAVVEELHNLFENLKTASSRSVKPTRELAELTIFSSAAVADFRRASISSPHGPPNLSSIMDGPVYGPQWPPPLPPPLPTTVEEDIEMIDHPRNKIAENGDDSSEATLVDLDQLPPSYGETTGNEESSSGDDAVMVNGEDSSPDKPSALEKPPPIPPRNKSGLVIQTNENKDLLPNDELWKFGSQQDVTEVIGNVMFRLQCAIKPTSIEETSGAQIDIIRDTFFGANTVYTQKAQSLERKTEAWPSIIVFPGKVGRDIYEALDVVYDEQQVEIDNTTVPQYASLSKLPPILQIHIQRTDFDHETHRAFKNRNPVVFPETIYLDRYVDTGDPNSAIMRRRREAWGWKELLRTLEARYSALKNDQAQISVLDALSATKDFVSNLQEEEIEGIEVDPALPEALEERISEVAAELEAITGRINDLRSRIQGQFIDMREYEYKLQSVFIHRGEAGGGHYWIYIYDFEHDIWREYNDEWVSEVKDRRTIFEHQGGAGGTPYYLVYVKSSDIKNLVNAVCRDVQEVEATHTTEEWPDLMENGVSAALNEDEDSPEMRHVEHAKPRPLRPKPSVIEQSAWEADAWKENEGLKDGAKVDANGKPW
jgi:ubiquitin carboxyl-terminal hydrolase 25